MRTRLSLRSPAGLFKKLANAFLHPFLCLRALTRRGQRESTAETQPKLHPAAADSAAFALHTAMTK
jgi:hypothetical protein